MFLTANVKPGSLRCMDLTISNTENCHDNQVLAMQPWSLTWGCVPMELISTAPDNHNNKKPPPTHRNGVLPPQELRLDRSWQRWLNETDGNPEWRETTRPWYEKCQFQTNRHWHKTPRTHLEAATASENVKPWRLKRQQTPTSNLIWICVSERYKSHWVDS